MVFHDGVVILCARYSTITCSTKQSGRVTIKHQLCLCACGLTTRYFIDILLLPIIGTCFMFEKPQQEKGGKMKKEKSFLKEFGKVAALSAGLLIGAQSAEAGKVDMFKDLDSMDVPHAEKKTPMKYSSPEEQKNITPDKKGAGMFEAVDKLELLDQKYASAKTEQEKDGLRQEIARTALMSGGSGKILSQKDGQISNMRVGTWVVSARSDGNVVTGSIVSSSGAEKSIFAFTLR